MRGKLYAKKDREKVEQLLLNGKSYNEIGKLLGVPKSTISTWFGKTLKRPINKQVRKEHFLRIRKLASISLKKKWDRKREEEVLSIKAKVDKELKNCPQRDISFYKPLLAMLYWAEGSKYKGVRNTEFINTDPDLALLYITLLRKCYDINENKFSIWIRVHYYHSIKQVKNYWSKLLNIPLNQFYKVSIKKRSKTKRFRKNFVGICSIRYKNSIIGKELMETGRSLLKLIKNAPIA